MVQLETEAGDKMCGVVRYCGDYPQRPGHWVGVELEDEVRGGSNGWTQVRKKYFKICLIGVYRQVCFNALYCIGCFDTC